MGINDDILARLPPKSRAKLVVLNDAHDDALAALRGTWENAAAERSISNDLERRVRDQLDRMPQKFGRPVEDVEKIEAPLEPQREKLAAANARYARASEAFEINWAFFTDANAWLDRYFKNGGDLEHAPPPAPTLRKGESHAQAVARVRAEIETAEADWHRAETAPAPADQLKQEITEKLDQLIARKPIAVSATRRIADPADLDAATKLAVHGGTLFGDGGLHLLLFAVRETLIEKLHAQVDALDLTDALTDDERDAGFREIAERKLELERLEEAHVAAAAAEGVTIVRRRSADPRAVLEIQEAFS